MLKSIGFGCLGLILSPPLPRGMHDLGQDC